MYEAKGKNTEPVLSYSGNNKRICDMYSIYLQLADHRYLLYILKQSAELHLIVYFVFYHMAYLEKAPTQ